ncbi:ABC transporter ATP-binding protein [Companilactobacillus metriopterae]|uniref:ABC transporter ATP-binding protein n=1 Tax=Companilactobacillus metriopterae TaxID=1909267 RepID=UPI00100A6FC6|nr:ATP-binding cassette domain-containing protein [Companilactobacillus metriopterae]
MNIIEINNLVYQVDSNTIIDNVSLKISKGDYLTFIGPSGSGKSTLMKLISDMISPTSGEIIFEGKNMDDYDPTEYRKKVSYAFQQPNLFGKTVRDNLEFPFELRNEKVDTEKIIDYLKLVNLDESYLEKSVTEVSGGERQRVALLRNLLFTPEVIILDEVTAGLDTDNKQIVHNLINQFNKDYKVTVLQITHDESEIEEAKKIINIVGGKIENA